jgi:Zn-dependent M28 family amino/carboxypeptidase
MDEAVDELIGRTWRDEFPWTFLTRLTEIGPRLGGSNGERRAAELVADALDDAGADPEIRPFDIMTWERGSAELGVVAEREERERDDTERDDTERDDAENGDRDRRDRRIERSFEAVALPYTPPGEVHALVVDVGHGTPEEIEATDVRGNVAVADTESPRGVRRVHRMEKYGHAVAGGAAAFVFAHARPGKLPPTGSIRFGDEGAVPAVGVSRETGAWLREYAPDAAVRLRVDAATEAGQSRNVLGRLGPDEEPGVLVVAHHDAHDVGEGALDNGCGVTTAVTAARLLARPAFDLDCRVWVATVGCEETGLMGAETLAERLGPERVRAVVNVDGAGRHRDLRALTHGSDAMRALAERVLDDVGHPLAVTERPHPYSDHWPFLRAGVPSLQLHSQRANGREEGWRRGWTHTAADTRDKVDVRNPRAHAVLTALLVRALGREQPPRIDADDLAERLRSVGAEPGMRAAGVWPGAWDE